MSLSDFRFSLTEMRLPVKQREKTLNPQSRVRFSGDPPEYFGIVALRQLRPTFNRNDVSSILTGPTMHPWLELNQAPAF